MADDVRRKGEHPDGLDGALIGPDASMDRRGFLSISTLALLGIAAGATAIEPSTALALLREPATAAAVWKPLTALSDVSVAANASAKKYPRLVPGSAFDNHPAVKLVESALEGLSGGSAVAAIQAVVASGGTVLIKPNWVEPTKWSSGKITHPSLVIAVARLAAEAVGATGDVIIGEGTSEGKDLPRVLSATSFMHALSSFGLDAATSSRARVRVVDLNSASTGSSLVRLHGASRFAGTHDKVYDASGRVIGRMGDAHVGNYHIAAPILQADLIIDFAKSKVHCSAGVTLSLKNFVGVVPSSADPKGKKRLKAVPHSSASDAHSGRTYVLNRTIGRTSADLTACSVYANSSGTLMSAPQRKLLCIVDGVVSGSRTQFSPTPVATGWVAAGYDPVAVDHVAARCMGFDPAKVESLKASTHGTLALGTGNPAGVRVIYHGSSSFTGYFSAKRTLKAESVTAKWGNAIVLKTRTIKSPHVSVAGSRVTVKPAGSVSAVRLYTGTDFANLPRGAGGIFAGDVPPGTVGPVRVVVMDAHFNLWDRLVIA